MLLLARLCGLAVAAQALLAPPLRRTSPRGAAAPRRSARTHLAAAAEDDDATCATVDEYNAEAEVLMLQAARQSPNHTRLRCATARGCHINCVRAPLSCSSLSFFDSDPLESPQRSHGSLDAASRDRGSLTPPRAIGAH